MSTYNLEVTNNYSSGTVFTIYQKSLSIPNDSNIFTLAWICRYVSSNSNVKFSWQKTYDAVYSQPGEKLKIGTVCDTSSLTESCIQNISTKSSQSIKIDLKSSLTTTTLSYLKDYNSYRFKLQETENSGDNKIYTKTDISVPNYCSSPNSAVVGLGIGMSGCGLFLVGGEPNKTTEWTINEPSYYLVTGSYKTGEIIDLNQVKDKSIYIPYDGVLSRAVILDKNNNLKLVD